MSTAPHQVIIIGTGFGGLCMGIQLKQSGINDFVMLERNAEVGGVWRDNRYPGAACDIPSHLYSYSFAPKHDWSRRYPSQPEIFTYQKDCAQKYGLYPHIQFNSEVASASFDEGQGLWTVTTKDGNTLQSQFVVSGVGQLSRPAYPNIIGKDDFQGKAFHSADWDESYSLEGKNVAVIGTGASAIQFIPEVAKQAKKLHVYQRSAPYILPKPDGDYGAISQAAFQRIPGMRSTYRWLIYRWLGEGTIEAFNNSDSKAAAMLQRIAKWHLDLKVKDKELKAKLTPDYPMGCKRVLFTSNYYPALAQDNVELHTGPVNAITKTGVDAGADSCEVDTIIWGTGFAATDFLAPMEITGRDGLNLNTAWKDGAEAYLGITTSGFPNLFMLYGPNTNLGNNSIIFMIECQVQYILQCIAATRDTGKRFLDVKTDVQKSFNDGLQEQLQNTVWSAGCSSWYHNDAGKITNNWPGATRRYKQLTETLDTADFEFA